MLRNSVTIVTNTPGVCDEPSLIIISGRDGNGNSIASVLAFAPIMRVGERWGVVGVDAVAEGCGEHEGWLLMCA